MEQQHHAFKDQNQCMAHTCESKKRLKFQAVQSLGVCLCRVPAAAFKTWPVFKTGTATGGCVPNLLEGEGLGFCPGSLGTSYHKNLN